MALSVSPYTHSIVTQRKSKLRSKQENKVLCNTKQLSSHFIYFPIIFCVLSRCINIYAQKSLLFMYYIAKKVFLLNNWTTTISVRSKKHQEILPDFIKLNIHLCESRMHQWLKYNNQWLKIYIHLKVPCTD